MLCGWPWLFGPGSGQWRARRRLASWPERLTEAGPSDLRRVCVSDSSAGRGTAKFDGGLEEWVRGEHKWGVGTGTAKEACCQGCT